MTLRLVNTLQHSNESGVRAWHASWSWDGKFLASTGEDKVIKIWSDADNSNIRCISTLEDAQSRTIRACEWSPDGNFIASASFDGTVVVWEAQNANKFTWDQVASIEGHESEVKSVAWSPSGLFLATCGRDKKVWIWEKFGGSEFECVCVLDGHSQDVKFVCWHPTESILLSSSYDDTIKVWGSENDDWFCIQTLVGHESTVWGLGFNADGSKFVSCSDDLSLRLWESDHTGKLAGSGSFNLAASLNDLHEFPVYSCHWSPVHGLIVTGSGDNSITVCSSDNSSLLSVQSKRIEAHSGDVNCVRWNPQAASAYLLASAGDDGIIKLWRWEI